MSFLAQAAMTTDYIIIPGPASHNARLSSRATCQLFHSMHGVRQCMTPTMQRSDMSIPKGVRSLSAWFLVCQVLSNLSHKGSPTTPCRRMRKRHTDEMFLPAAMMPMLASAACCLRRDASTSDTAGRPICKEHLCSICAAPPALGRSCKGTSQQRMHVCSQAARTDSAM